MGLPGAVTAALGAFGSVLTKITVLLGGGCRPGLEDNLRDIDFIKSELEKLQSCLLRIWAMEDPGMAVMDDGIMAVARKLSSDLSDAIDRFRLLGPESCDDGGSERVFEGLKAQVQGFVDQCCKKVDTLDLTTNCNTMLDDPRPTFVRVDESQLMEMEQQRAKVIRLLQEHETICIHGFAGMGKTTLADLVYQAEGEKYKCKAFVSVSPRPNMMKILTAIFTQVIESFYSCKRGPTYSVDSQELVSKVIAHKRKETDNEDDSQYLQKILSKLLWAPSGATIDTEQLSGANEVNEEYLTCIISTFLEDQRYLVIVDDIWSCEQWEVFKKSLPKNNKGSRIITTTRVNSIAEKCGTDDHAIIYKIARLSIVAAEELLLRKFKESSKLPALPSDSDLQRTCSLISKFSSGMPLAIICLSAAMTEQPSQDAEQLLSLNDSATQGLKGFVKMSCMKPLIKSLVLGYHHLPVYLKTCLLQCTMYPANERFERDDLIRIWVAEGFVEEEKASGYFRELLEWGYINLSEGNGSLPSFEYEINTVLLAVLGCQTQEYDFVASSGYFSNKESMYGRRICRFSVQGGLSSWQISRLDFSSMRSLAVFGRASLIPFERLSHLQLLYLDEDRNLEDKELCNYPDLRDDDLVDICELILLRYLRLKGCKITELPPEIGKLQLLETLDVRGTGVRELQGKIFELQLLKTLNISNTAVTNLPREIKKLRQLKSLDVSGTSIRELKREIGELQCLETLCVSNTMIAEIPKEIGKLQKLKTLDVCNTRVKVIPKEIGELQELEILNVSKTKINVLPTEIGTLQHLETLDVSDTELDRLPKEFWLLPQLKTVNIINTKIRNLPLDAHWISNSIRVIAGKHDHPKVVNMLQYNCKALEGSDSTLAKEHREELSIVLFDHLHSRWEPVDFARVKVAKSHMKVPTWVRDHLKDISSLEISLFKLDEDDIKFLQEMPNLQVLVLRVDVLRRIYITDQGFSKLESFCLDCRVPRVTFQDDAMPKLKHLQFILYAFRATEALGGGIMHLQNLERVHFWVASEYKPDAPGINKIVDIVTKEAHERNLTICINGKEVVHKEKRARNPPVDSYSIDGAGSSTVTVTVENPPRNDGDNGYDLSSQDFDGEVLMREGRGKKHGRDWTSTSTLDTSTTTPSLSQIQARRTSTSLVIRPRPNTTQHRMKSLQAQLEKERRLRFEIVARMEADRQRMETERQRMEQIFQWMQIVGEKMGQPLPPMLFPSPPSPASTPIQSVESNDGPRDRGDSP